MMTTYINDKDISLTFWKKGYIGSGVRLVDKFLGLCEESCDW